jgi:hypothetical protein
MTNRYTGPSTTTAEVAANYLDRRDEEVIQALVTVGAFVALADGQLQAVERHELAIFVDRQGFAPTISQREVAEAFDNPVQQIEDRRQRKRDRRKPTSVRWPIIGVRRGSHRGAGRCRGSKNSPRRVAGPKANTAGHDDPADQEAVRGVFCIGAQVAVCAEHAMTPVASPRPRTGFASREVQQQ